MVDLHHSVPVAASPDRVYAAVATQAGMQGWWTRDTTMIPQPGGKADFGFDKRSALFHMVIDDLRPNRGIRMTCSGDHPEWAGTTLEWTIAETPEGSVLKFEHRGWREVTDFCASCNSMWGNLMFRLKAFVETGKPAPQWTE
jgi:uncharacterized protein YndB with AHSA1/START domain